ncbi:MAG TPA: hypothetical protein VK272_12540 [Solirubrobacteraceae bacterium]|nr:hypothetical protein [Solirubrobacteraceae bacterium]
MSLIRLLGIRYPDLGWATTVNSDAEQLYLGHTLYQSPAHGYTGQIYTPLFPTMVSLFDRLYLWNGWALLLIIGASAALAALAARLAYSRASGAPRVVCMLGAAGIGGVAYWCVASVGLPVLDEARSDQLAWAFALFGLIVVADFGPVPTRRRVVAAALLLSAALWTKQTTIGVVAPAFAWVGGLAAFSALNRKAALLFAAVLLGVNVLLLVVLNLLTHGWEFYINFEMATRQATEFTYGENITKGLRSAALAIGFAAAMWLASAMVVATHRRRGSASPQMRSSAGNVRRLLSADDPTGRRVLLLALYVVFGFALAAYFMRKQGTETNQMIGVVWALGLLAAVGWRVAQRHIGAVMAAGGCVALFFMLTQLGPVEEIAASAEINIPNLEEAVQWQSVPTELRLWARQHTLYSPFYSDLNVPQGGPLYPNYFNFADLLASGNQPTYLVRALLDRRFEGVAGFSLEGDSYSSGLGKWEENYLWKLDEVIAARYAPEPGLPQGVLGRRPGPERASWMRNCFGPFAAGGASFRIHRGGGFWCSFSPDHLQLVRAPTPLSEVVTTQSVSLAGAVTVSFEGAVSKQADVVLDGGAGANWVARVATVPGKSHDLSVSTSLDGAPLGSRLVPASIAPGGKRTLQLDVTSTQGHLSAPVSVRPGAVTLTAPARKAPLALVATDGVAVDLDATRLRH